MEKLKDETVKEIIEAMLATDAPDIAFSVYMLPHSPTNYGSLSKKDKAKVRNYRNTVYEFLLVFSDEEKRKEFLDNNKDLYYFIEEYKISEESLKIASREISSSEELSSIGEEAVKSLYYCSKAIKESFGELEINEVIKKLFKLHRPDLAYGIFKTSYNPIDNEMDKNMKKSFSFAILEFLNYIDCYKEAVEDRKIQILKDYLKNHVVLGDFFREYKEEVTAFFLPA